ncbi:hypothetical protein [Streptomyces sp. NPDC047972]|uniref:hypothetical protein n=1 Tax=Streptomyces sp. NPDC047972 TaxID=3365493 RepID=UPI00371C970B
MDESLKAPAGWRFAAYPWWAMDELPELPKLVRVGAVLLPEFFHLVIAPEGAWRTLRDGSEDVFGRSGPVLFLNFQVFEGDLMMNEARTAYEDVGVVLEKVRKVAKPQKWKVLGIHYMTQYLVQFMEEGGRPEQDHMRAGHDWAALEPSDPYGHRPKAALEWLDQLQSQASEAYATARDAPSPRRKRVRITDDFLRQVAKVYRIAENSGAPPTREVANHFKAPHSTAAKWVASARRKKMLPPAGVSAGGYGDPHAERRLELEWILKDSHEDLSPHKRRELEMELQSLGGEIPGRDD